MPIRALSIPTQPILTPPNQVPPNQVLPSRGPATRAPRRSLPAVIVAFALGLVGLVALAGPVQAADAIAITPGQVFSVQVSGIRQVQTFTFTGAAGQRVTLNTSSNGSSGYLYQLSGPGGTLPPTTVDIFGELGELSTSGTWTLTAMNIGTTNAVMQATLGLVTDVSAPLPLSVATTQPLDVPGRNFSYTFTGAAGQKLVIDIPTLTLNTELPGQVPGVSFRLRRPDGTFADDLLNDYSDGPDLISAIVDASGTWTLVIDPAKDATGNITFTATHPVDQVLQVIPGRATRVSYSGGGHDVRLTLHARAGQRLTLTTVTSALSTPYSRLPEPYVDATLIRPNGSPAGEIGEIFGPRFAEYLQPLDATGTWTVLLDAIRGTIGTQTIKIGLADDISGTAKLGRPLPIRISEPGQNASYTFQGTAGQPLTATLTNARLVAGRAGGDPAAAGLTLTLLGPDGEVLGTLLNPDQQATGEYPELPVTGRYTVKLDPAQDTVGTATLKLR